MANHALIYLFAFALPGFVGFFSFSIYTRILSPEEYAIYSIGASLSFLIGSVVYGWIRFSLGRYQSETPEANFLPFAMVCYLAVTVVLAPVAFFSSSLMQSVATFTVVAILLLAVSQALFDIVQEIRRARHQSMSFAKANVGRSLLSFTCAVAGAFYFDSGSGLVLGISVGFFALAFLFLVSNRQALHENVLPLVEVKRFMRYGFPLALSGLVFSGNPTMARLLVGATLGAAEAGRFGAALDVTSQIAGIVAASVSSILAPLAIRANALGGQAAARIKLADGVELFLAAMVPTTIGLVVLSHSFSDVVAGPEFEQAVHAMLPILAVSRGLNAFAQFYLHLGFQIVERPLRQVVCGAITLLVNAAASIVLIQLYGINGAAYGLLVGDIVGIGVSLLLLRPVFPMPIPWRSVVKVGICTAVMAIVCIPIDVLLAGRPVMSLVLTPVVGALVFGLAAYVLDVAKLRSALFDAGVAKIEGWFK